MKLIRNMVFLSGSEIVSKIVTFATVAYIARIAGPVSYGYVEFAAAVLLCVGLIVDLGFGPYGAREIAKAPQHTAELVNEIVLARFILAIMAYDIIIAFAVLFDHPAIVTQLLLLFGLSLLVTPLLLHWVFQGHNAMITVGLLQIIRQAVYAVVIFAFVRNASNLSMVAVAEIAGVCSAAACGVWLYHCQLGGALSLRRRLSRQLLIEGVPIGLSQMFWMTRMYGATVIVGMIASPEDVGFFGGAMRILIALHAFIWLYFFNLLPSLSQAWQRNDGTFAVLIRRSLYSVAWLGVVGGIVWVMLAPIIMPAVYGPAFAPAGVALQWLTGVAIAAGLSGHYRYGLIAAGQQNVEMIISAIGSAFAVILIPIGYLSVGVSGAAIGVGIAELVVWLSAWWMASKRLRLSGHMQLLNRPLIVTAATFVVLGLLPLSSLGMRLMIVVTSIAVLIGRYF